MLGFLVTLVFCGVVTVAGLGLLGKFVEGLDPAERVGVSGLLGLGVFGTLLGLAGFVSVGAGFGVAGASLLVGLIWAVKGRSWEALRFSKPEGAGFVFVGGIGLLMVLPLIAVLAPSSVMDWDSIAYHLAVPKMWLQDGAVHPYAWEHHSFFPAGMDALFMAGLVWGGQAGAKAFMWVALLLSAILVFGISRRLWGEKTAWWAPVVLVGAPVVLWESGTAYIDVPHGVFCGVGVWYLAEVVWKRVNGLEEGEGDSQGFVLLAAMMLALGIGTKYTGLQIVVTAAVTFVIASLVTKPKSSGSASWLGQMGLASVVILVLGGGWYVRNFAVSGNAVYPFFHSVMPGKYWDEWRAEIYADEQQTFGVGRTESGRDISQIGHGVLGMAYQPGRFVNPAQTTGGGFPSGAVGLASMAILFGAAVSGRLGTREKVLLGWVGLVFLMWFFLSQQSRYMTYLCVAGALLLPGLIVRWRAMGQVLAGLAVAQALYTGWMLWATQGQLQWAVVSGAVSETDYLAQTTPFTRVAADLNGDESVESVALFDEVFGFYLDKKYYWANPGHSTLTDFGAMESGADLAAGLWESPSHVYMNLQFMPRDVQEQWYQAAGLLPGAGYSEEERAEMFGDLNLRWRWLMADAVRSGAMEVDRTYPFGVVLRVVR